MTEERCSRCKNTIYTCATCNQVYDVEISSKAHSQECARINDPYQHQGLCHQCNYAENLRKFHYRGNANSDSQINGDSQVSNNLRTLPSIPKPPALGGAKICNLGGSDKLQILPSMLIPPALGGTHTVNGTGQALSDNKIPDLPTMPNPPVPQTQEQDTALDFASYLRNVSASDTIEVLETTTTQGSHQVSQNTRQRSKIAGGKRAKRAGVLPTDPNRKMEQEINRLRSEIKYLKATVQTVNSQKWRNVQQITQLTNDFKAKERDAAYWYQEKCRLEIQSEERKQQINALEYELIDRHKDATTQYKMYTEKDEEQKHKINLLENRLTIKEGEFRVLKETYDEEILQLRIRSDEAEKSRFQAVLSLRNNRMCLVGLDLPPPNGSKRVAEAEKQ